MLAAFEKELATQPKPARAGRLHYECARLLEWPLAEVARAAEHFQKAHAMLPSHVPSVRGARRTNVALKRYAQALPFFDAEIRLTSDPQQKAVVYYEKGLVLEDALGARPEARAAFEAGLELDPTNTSLLKAVERSAMAAKAWEALDRTYERAANAVTKDTRLKAAVIAERARIVEARRSDVKGATELYRLALETDPRTTTAIHALKRLCFAEDRFADLVTVLAREADLVADPAARAFAFYRAGRVQSDRLGALKQASESFEKAAVEAPDDRVVLEELARAYELGKQWGELSTVLERLARLSERPSEKVGYYHRMGQIAEERLASEESAIVWYEKARSLDPVYLPALQALVKLYTKREAFGELLAVHSGEAEDALDSGRRASAHARMAEIYERRLGNVEQAAEHHRKALGLVPGFAPSFKALERLLVQSAHFTELAELYERAVDLAPDAEGKTTWLFKIGRLHEDALGEPVQALAAYARIVQGEPKHLGAIHAMQRAAERAGRWKELIAALELEVPLANDKRRRVEILLRAGEVAEVELADEKIALAYFRKAVELDPAHAAALSSLGRLHYKAGRWEDLVETYRSELALNPKGPAAAALLYKMGEIFEERIGKDEDALTSYRRAVDADPTHRPALHALERKLQEKGKWDELVRLLELELGATKASDERSRAAFRIGEVYENRLRQPDKALAAFEQSLAADPDFRPARDGRVRLLTHARDWKRLGDELEKEAKGARDPALAVAALLRAGELYRDELADPAKAIASFEAVLERDPAHVEALLALEPLYAEKGAWDSLATAYATEARVLSDPGARIAVLRELARIEERRAGDDLKSVRDAQLMVLQLAPSDPAALAALERLALRAGDAAEVGQVDAQLASSSDPAVAAEHTTRLAELLEASGDASALGLFRTALTREPDNVAAAYGFSRMAERLRDPKLLEEAASRLVEVAFDRAGAARLYVQAAEVHAAAHDGEGAASMLECALEVNPENEPAATRLVELLGGNADPTRLIRALSQAASAATERDRVAELWIRVAELQAEKKHDTPAALAALQRALGNLPGHVAILTKLSELYVRDGQWTQAVDRLNQIVSQAGAPQRARLDAHARLAAILDERLGEPEKARASVEAVLAVEPHHAAALARLVKLELRRGRLDAAGEAAARLVQVSSSADDRVEALTAQGRVERARGRRGSAGKAFAEAIELAGLDCEAAQGLVELIGEVPRKPDAPGWDVYLAALGRFAEQPQASAVERASTYVEIARVLGGPLGQPEQAIQALERGLSLGANPALHAELAERLLEAGNPGKAMQSLRRVIELDPRNADAWRKLGESFKGLGKRGEATLTLSVLAALGHANDLELATLAQNPPRPAAAPPRSFDANELQAIGLVPDNDPAARLLSELSDLLEKIYAPDLDRFGVGSRDRLGQRSANPLRQLADRIGVIFGVSDDFDLYVHGGKGSAVEVEFTDPISILVPSAVLKLSESGQVFALARVLANVARKLHAVDRLGPEQLELLLGAAARMVDASFPATASGEEAIASLSRRVSRALPWIGRGGIEDAARDYAAARRVDPVEWARRVRTSAARAALLVSDDLAAAVTVVRRSEGDLSGATGPTLAEGSRLADDLMGFWVSEGAISVRRRLGLL
jgi:tetratricopeptide (TPR) repeat protein